MGGGCPNTNQRPHTMCKGIGGGLSQHKSTSPHHVQRDWWGLVPTQINVSTPCVKGLVGGCPNTNQRPHTMCKGIGGGLSQHKSTSPHHVQRDWWGLVPTQINVSTPCVKGLVGGCPNTNQRPQTMCKGIGGGGIPTQINVPTPCAKGLVGGGIPTQINVPTPCAKGLVGACPNTNHGLHTMCKGIGGGVSQYKSTSPHYVQMDWWGRVATQINVPTPCVKGLVGACPNTNQRPQTMCKWIGGGGCPNTNQRPHIMCKRIGGGLSQHKSTSRHHVQMDWWGLVPTQINVPTPCAKGLVGACPNTNQRPHTMCKGIGGGGVSQHKSTSGHHV